MSTETTLADGTRVGRKDWAGDAVYWQVKYDTLLAEHQQLTERVAELERENEGLRHARATLIADYQEETRLRLDALQEAEAAEARVRLLEEALRIAQHQLHPMTHPYTCGINSTHLPLVPMMTDEGVVLVCRGSGRLGRDLMPEPCDYTQTLRAPQHTSEEVGG